MTTEYRRINGGVAGGLLAVVSYLATRVYLQLGVGRGGTGLLHYDSYYALAFARELKREGHWLFFHNPFGSFDGSARLLNGPATLARLTMPLWDGHLLAFDLITGTLLALLGGYWFGRLAFRLSEQPPAVTLIVVAFVMLGSGAGYAFQTIHDGGLGGLTAPLLWGSDWGLSWNANNLLSWEVAYHAVVWGGLWAAVTGRRWLPAIASVALAFLNPFALTTYAVVLAAYLAYTIYRPSAVEEADQRRALLVAVVIALAGMAAWEFLLPAFSKDAHYFKDVYAHRNYVIGPRELFLFGGPVVLLFTVFLVSAWRQGQLRESTRSHAVWLLAAALPFLAIAFGYRHLPHVPLPAHWTRVYPFAFLALAALALPTGPKARAPLVVAAILFVIGAADASIGNFYLASDYRLGTPPVALDHDEHALVAELRRLPPGRFVYVRKCRGDAGAGPELEYSVAALTPQKTLFGHIDFSPTMAGDLRTVTTCGPAFKHPAPGTYVLTDSGYASKWPARYARRPFGRFVLLLPR